MAENVRNQGAKTIPLTPPGGGYEVLPARGQRYGLIVQNNGANTIYLKFGSFDFTDLDSALKMAPGAVIILNTPMGDAVYGKADTADTDVYAVHW